MGARREPWSIELAALLRLEVEHGAQDRLRIVDLRVDVGDEDHPPVTALILARGHTRLAVPPTTITAIAGDRLQITTLADAEPAEPRAGDVLLVRDVLDSLVLDLQGRRGARVNDLLLSDEDGALRLVAADMGARAILRRVSGGRLGAAAASDWRDWRYVEFLRGDPGCVGTGAAYHRRIVRLPAGEIARLSDALPYLHAAELLLLLPDALGAEVLAMLGPERQLQVFEELPESEALHLLGLLPPDAAVDLIAQLDAPRAAQLVGRLPPSRRAQIVELLQYPADTVGGIMNNELVVLPSHLTVAEAIARLRDALKGPAFVYYVFVVDDLRARRLRGLVTLRHLLTQDPERRLDAAMDPYLTTLAPTDPATTASFAVLDHRLQALPVVGGDGKLLGAVTIDSALAQVAPRTWMTRSRRLFA